MPRRHSPALLLILFFILVIAGIGCLDRSFAELFLPLYRQSLAFLAPDAWNIAWLRLAQEGRETFITVRVATTSPSFLAGAVIPAGTGMTGSTLLGHALQPPLLMFTLILAWLFMAPGRRLGPALLALPLLFLVEAVDVPLVLLGSLWDILHANFAPDAPLPWQAPLMHFLNGGGRQALSLTAAFIAMAFGSWLQGWLPCRRLLGCSVPAGEECGFTAGTPPEKVFPEPDIAAVKRMMVS